MQPPHCCNRLTAPAATWQRPPALQPGGRQRSPPRALVGLVQLLGARVVPVRVPALIDHGAGQRAQDALQPRQERGQAVVLGVANGG